MSMGSELELTGSVVSGGSEVSELPARTTPVYLRCRNSERVSLVKSPDCPHVSSQSIELDRTKWSSHSRQFGRNTWLRLFEHGQFPKFCRGWIGSRFKLVLRIDILVIARTKKPKLVRKSFSDEASDMSQFHFTHQMFDLPARHGFVGITA
jgi:hypothetical protein